MLITKLVSSIAPIYCAERMGGMNESSITIRTSSLGAALKIVASCVNLVPLKPLASHISEKIFRLSGQLLKDDSLVLVQIQLKPDILEGIW